MATRLIISESISFAHRLQSHPGKCSTLHGHNAEVVVEISGTPSLETGMIVDSYDVKNVIRGLDHQTILEYSDPLVEAISTVHSVVSLPYPPTTENLSNYLAGKIGNFPNVAQVIVTFPETDNLIASTVFSKERVGIDREI